MDEERKLKTGNYVINYKNGSPMSRSRITRALKTKAESAGGAIFEIDIDKNGTVKEKHPQPYSLWTHKIQTCKRLIDLKQAINHRELVEYINCKISSIELDSLEKIKSIIDSSFKNS